MLGEYLGTRPDVDPTAYVAEGARVIGQVTIGPESSVWFGSVVRGDIHWIKIGRRTNIQDGCILHVTQELFPLTIGDMVTVGHGAVLHGCTVDDLCLIGMGAVILDGSHIGEGSIVAAGAVVREGQKVPPGSLVAGVPAKVRREVTPREREANRISAEHYVERIREYRNP